MSDPWQALVRELDRWYAAGELADFWWRDDDAMKPSAALEQLLALSRAARVKIALAVIPAGVEAGLSRLLGRAEPPVAVLQHGYAHRNHRLGPGKKIELSAARLEAELDAELRRGLARLLELFGGYFLPALVPPWNRIDAAVVPRLRPLGFRGLSVYGARPGARVSGLCRANCHVDLMRWSEPRGFVGEDIALGLLVDHLSARRRGGAERDETTGLLTHHLVHDSAVWTFLSDLLALLQDHPAARFRDPADIFESGVT